MTETEMIVDQAEHKVRIDIIGVETNAIFKVSDRLLQQAGAGMLNPVLEVLTGKLLALRLRLEEAQLGGSWCRQPANR
jgi:hypothetical protein